MVLDSGEVFMDQVKDESARDLLEPDVPVDQPKTSSSSATNPATRKSHPPKKERVSCNGFLGPKSSHQGAEKRPLLRRPLSMEMTPQHLRDSQDHVVHRKILQPPWRSGWATPSPPSRSLTSPSLGGGSWMRRSESTRSINYPLGSRVCRGQMRPATSMPHIAKGAGDPTLPTPTRPCVLVALRPLNLEQEKQAFFQSDYKYEPQFEYMQPEPRNVLDKYKEGSGLFLEQVVVRLSDELLSQAVMVVESCRPTLTINLAGARQHWLEGMLRHEIGTHYLRGVNNNLQPWATSEGRKQFGLKPANPTEEGLASLHSVLLRKQPYLWRAALLYYTVYHATSMSFSQLFSHIARFVQDPDIRWEYCLRAKRGQKDTSQPGCFSKDQVYLDGILRILRHRRTIDFKMLTSLGKVSFEDVEKLRHLAVLSRTRIPHFMRDQDRYLEHLDHIVHINELDDSTLEQLLP
ncbi:uncharacterized protein KIAA0895-like isoform X2 [Kryptolebias marmoratus]|uniref:uncharacterized protein KIAA0895-like isoform X2 n=1 Tax=Kryptolebias marmoratus TaxID=37003 RepID=UPI0007F919A9|nr:uncharacterized protein KIAA0895-like isoform X2 [Kryptolebias marmoratus]